MWHWFNDNAGAAQGIPTVVLVIVTIYYAWSTRQIATETRDMATATEQLTQLTREQQLDDDRPVIVFRIVQESPSFMDAPLRQEFALELVNAGVGPALDVNLEIVDTPFRWAFTADRSFPVTLAVNELIDMKITINLLDPFTDPGGLRWPRDQDDRELEYRVYHRREMVEKGYTGSHSADIVELNRRKTKFQLETRQLIAKVPDPGLLRASYHDIHQRSFLSMAALRDGIEVFEENYDPATMGYPPRRQLRLGPLHVEAPRATVGG